MAAKAKSLRDDVVISRGIRFPRDPAFIHGKVAELLRTDRYERRETEAALRVIGKSDVVIELGAGIGYMSTLIALKRRVTAVHAFEANPHLVPYIQRVHQANEVKSTHIEHAILGPRAGTASFHVRKDFMASSMDPFAEGEIIETTKVKVLNAKSVFKRLKPTVLICDIEGAEADLLPAIDLSTLRAAVIELHPQWIGPEGVMKIFNAFSAAGLAYFPRASTNKVVSFKRTW